MKSIVPSKQKPSAFFKNRKHEFHGIREAKDTIGRVNSSIENK